MNHSNLDRDRNGGDSIRWGDAIGWWLVTGISGLAAVWSGVMISTGWSWPFVVMVGLVGGGWAISYSLNWKKAVLGRWDGGKILDRAEARRIYWRVMVCPLAFLLNLIFAPLGMIEDLTPDAELPIFGFVVGFGFILSAIASSWMFPELRRQPERGREFIDYSTAKQRADRVSQRGDPAVYWGGLWLPEWMVTTHFAIMGATGSGKTISIRLLLQSINHLLHRDLDRRLLIYDAKQDTLSHLLGMKTAVPVHFLNPFDCRGSAWAIAEDCDEPAIAQQIAAIFIPEDTGPNRFFSDSARDILSSVMVAFQLRCPGRWTLRDVLLGCARPETVRHLLSLHPSTKDVLANFLDQRTLSNVLLSLQSHLVPFRTIAAAWDQASTSVSLRSWISSSDILILGNDETCRFAVDAVNRVIFLRLSQLLLSQSESATRRSYLVLDEVREAGKLDGLSSLLTKGRSKGVSLCLGFQDIDGMRSIYTEEVAHEMVGQIAQKVVLRLESPSSAEWASALFGDREQPRGEGSMKLGGEENQEPNNADREQRRLILPSEFLSLKPCTFQNGLTGYSLCPMIGAYKFHLSGELLQQMLEPRALDVPDFERRPAEHQHLRPWTDDDFRRLGFSSSF